MEDPNRWLRPTGIGKGRLTNASGQIQRPCRYPIQVKQNEKVGRPDIDSFEAMMARVCQKGFFISFDYSSDAVTEVGRFFRQTGRVIVLLTVREILDEQIAHKLA